MPELVLELFSEEIPARMQRQAGADLQRLALAHLDQEGLSYGRVQSFYGPRRLTLVVSDLPRSQGDRREERKGPRANAPEAALAGFLRSSGCAREDLVERDGIFFALISKPGRQTAEIIAEMVEKLVRGFPWPKSMRWGTGSLRWVRPLQSILCLFDGAIVPFDIDGLWSGDMTEGHRFMGETGPFSVRNFGDYLHGLKARFVMVSAEDRRLAIQNGARQICEARGLRLVEDEGLLDEVSGLAEWPTPLLGDIDPAFMDLPPEVIRTSMRTHQKYFAVRRPGVDGLAPHYVVIANIVAADEGAAILAGNSKVLAARLSDARFFWDEDHKTPLQDRLEKLKGVVFHAKIGTLFQRVERISALADRLSGPVGARADRAVRAAELCKADLASAMVGEFPELQGIMGAYYAKAFGEPPEVVCAIRDHYRPQGPGDGTPKEKTACVVALADKLDLLNSFFAIGEKPTGSKDPFALRRAALGIIRIILEHELRLNLKAYLTSEVADEVMAFLIDRLKVVLREEGRRHDLVDAVVALGGDDLTSIVERVDHVGRFLTTEDGASLLTGYRRAINILKAEEKKGGVFDGPPEIFADAAPAERALVQALDRAAPRVAAALEVDNFWLAMTELAALRAPVDGFFDTVLVNDPDPILRANRLKILLKVRDVANAVAVFSAISG